LHRQLECQCTRRAAHRRILRLLVGIPVLS
jgi:hypothetical protein